MDSFVTYKPDCCAESEQECAACVVGCANAVRRIAPGIDRVGLHRVFSEMFPDPACHQMFSVFLNAYQCEVHRKGPASATCEEPASGADGRR